MPSSATRSNCSTRRSSATAIRACVFDAALEQPTARLVIEALPTQYVDAQTMPDGPHGCMGVNAALACSDDALPIRDELFARRLRGEIKLRDRLRRARDEGDLPADSCPEQQARFVVTLSQGMAIRRPPASRANSCTRWWHCCCATGPCSAPSRPGQPMVLARSLGALRRQAAVRAAASMSSSASARRP
jgi:hypothetical protein